MPMSTIDEYLKVHYRESITLYYSDGEVIKQNWNGAFVLFAYAIAFTSAYAAVRILEQRLWRSDKENKYATSLIAKYPVASAAFILGFGTVWSMHFVGQSAVTLDHTPFCYDWWMTLASMQTAILLMWTGIQVAAFDIFSGHDREKKLKEILIKDPVVTRKNNRKKAKRIIHQIAYFHKLHYILAGSTLAAAGAVVMHYSGMYALKGPFRKEWKIPYIVGSVFIALVVFFVGFWIIFRPLHWKVEKTWIRPASAAVIALAVCGLDFFGMLSVIYVSDSELWDVCADLTLSNEVVPTDWTRHQILVVALSYIIPFIALYVERTISQELRSAYVELKDIRLIAAYRKSHRELYISPQETSHTTNAVLPHSPSNGDRTSSIPKDADPKDDNLPNFQLQKVEHCEEDGEIYRCEDDKVDLESTETRVMSGDLVEEEAKDGRQTSLPGRLDDGRLAYFYFA